MKLLKIVGITTLGLIALSWKKINDYSKVIESMQIYLRNFNLKSIKATWTKDQLFISFQLDVVFFNPTEIDFSFDTAGLIEVKKIELLYKGSKIGEANSTVSAIYLPPKTAYALEAVPFTVAVNNAIAAWAEKGIDTNLANYSIVVHVYAVGRTFIVEQ